METTMNELIHFIQKKYNDEKHSEILSEAYRLLKLEKEKNIELLFSYEKFCAEIHGFNCGNDVLIKINSFLNLKI